VWGCLDSAKKVPETSEVQSDGLSNGREQVRRLRGGDLVAGRALVKVVSRVKRNHAKRMRADAEKRTNDGEKAGEEPGFMLA